MNKIDSLPLTANFTNINNTETSSPNAVSASLLTLDKKPELTSTYNPNGLEAKSNQASFSSSFIKATLQASFTQPSDLKARSKISGVDSDSQEKSPIPVIKTEATSKADYDISKIPGIKDNPNVTPEFLAKVEVVAKELETDPATLLAIISFETGGQFSSATPNPSTNATGLIQFIPSTARSLLTKTLIDPKTSVSDKKKLIDSLPVDKQIKDELTKLATNTSLLPERKKQIDYGINNLTSKSKTLISQLKEAKDKKLPKEKQDEVNSQLKEVLTQKSQLQAEKKQVSSEISRLPQSIDSKITKDLAIETFKNMTNTEQLDYVKQYLLPYKGKLNNPQDAYLSVLFPQAVGKGNTPNATVFSQGSEYYEKNKGLDGIINGKKDGIVTVEEATKKVTDFLRNAKQ